MCFCVAVFEKNSENSMLKRNQFKIALVATSLSFGASQALAQENVSSTATVTVSNAFTLQEVAPIDFGTVRLSYDYQSGDADTGAIMTINADGSPVVLTAADFSTATDGSASFTEILPGSPAEYPITGAAPFTAVGVTTLPTATLANPASPGAQLLLTVTATNFEIVGGTNPGDAYDQSGVSSNMITDATGAVGFLMGGTVTTLITDVTYGDGAYTGTYSVQVDY
jgi:hypothetical protein